MKFLSSIVATGTMVLFQNCTQITTLSLITSYSEAAPLDIEDADMKRRRSLIVTAPSLMNSLGTSKFHMAYLLGEVGKYETPKRSAENLKRRPDDTPGLYNYNIFRNGLDEQKSNDRLPASIRIGDKTKNDRFLDQVFENWKDTTTNSKIDLNKLRNITNLNALKGGPFRMLAVVNRLDLAGDMDDRSSHEPTSEAKSMGELHIIYGLINEDYEKINKSAFPMTFALIYKLPILEESKGNLSLDRRTSDTDLIKNSRTWKAKIKIWGTLFQKLSSYEQGSVQYKNELVKLMNIIVKPENFIALRSNTQVSKTEFELRAWYNFTPSRRFISRKLRREPFRCLDGSDELVSMINYYWVNSYDDLDMHTRNTHLLDENGFQHLRAGYAIIRDNAIRYFKTPEYDYIFKKRPPAPLLDDSINPNLPAYRNNTTYWAGTNGKQKPLCGTNPHKDMPFTMMGGFHGGRGGEDTVSGNRLMFLAPFARVKPNQIWTMNNKVSEPKRHAFAIRTCSGCHSAEGASKGFHVFPRLANQKSELSSFMTGQTGNTFTYNRSKYVYDELGNRKKWLEDILSEKAELFDSLKRPERTR